MWSDGTRRRLAGRGLVLDRRADRILTDIEQTSDDTLKSKLTDIGRVRVLLLRLARVIENLAIWSEPACLMISTCAPCIWKKRLQDRIQAALAVPACRTIVHDHLPVFQECIAKQSKALAALQAGRARRRRGRLPPLDLYDDLAVEETGTPKHLKAISTNSSAW